MKRLLLLLPLLATSLTSTAGNATQIIYDTEGKELSSHSSYYVLPANRVIGGGLGLVPTGLRHCQFFVHQARDEAQLGFPVRFTPQNALSSEAVRMSSNVRINFARYLTTCMESSDWHLFTARSPHSLPGWREHVAIGRHDPPSPKVFRIEEMHDGDEVGYKLVSCADEGPCKDLGLHAHKDKTLLTVSDVPLVVLFRKA